MKRTMMQRPQPDGYICMPSYAPGGGGDKATPQPSGGSGGSNRTACQTYTWVHPDGQMDGCGWSAGDVPQNGSGSSGCNR